MSLTNFSVFSDITQFKFSVEKSKRSLEILFLIRSLNILVNFFKHFLNYLIYKNKKILKEFYFKIIIRKINNFFKYFIENLILINKIYLIS